MENERSLLPADPNFYPNQVVVPGVDQEDNPQQQNEDNSESERVSGLAKQVLGISGSTIMAAVSGYKDIATGLSILFKMGGFFLISTFIFAVILMTSELLYTSHQAQRNRCTDLSRTILVTVTGILLMATNTIFVVLINKGNAVFTVLLFPTALIVGMLASAEGPVDAAQDSTLDRAYESAMKSGSELASFGATAAFAMEGAIILGYLKNPSFGRCHPQVDLAISYFASMVCTVAMTVTALPVSLLFPSFKARLVEITKQLRYAMLASLASMAMVLAVEFLEMKFMLSFLPELIAGVLNIVIVFWGEDAAARAQRVGESRGDQPHSMVKLVATMSFTLMAGTYAVYLGYEKYDVFVKASMLVMLAAIISSLRQMARPFNLPRTGSCAVVVGSISLVFPGLAMVIAVPLLVKIFVHLYFRR